MQFTEHLWFTSSRSNDDQGCVEVAFTENTWRKSSRTTDTGQCVEVALASQAVGVRDSKNRAAGHFTVDAAKWGAFLGTVKTGVLDR